MDIWLRTRGHPRELDYQFVGEAPGDSWWREYRPVTDVERPTILLRSDGKWWRAYVAGIRSGRLDATDNHIQVNLVLAGGCGPGDENTLALGLIRRLAAGLAQEEGRFIPAGPLADRLPAAEVERMLTSPGRDTRLAVAAAVRAAYGPGAPGGDPSPSRASWPQDDWLGGLADPVAQEAFDVLAGQLLGGSPGQAVALNLVEAEEDLSELPRLVGARGVLSARPGPHIWAAVRPLGKAGAPATEPPRRKVRASRPGRGRTAALILAGTLAAAALAVLVVWLTGHPFR